MTAIDGPEKKAAKSASEGPRSNLRYTQYETLVSELRGLTSCTAAAVSTQYLQAQRGTKEVQ